MGWGIFFSVLFMLVVIFLLVSYWFMPFNNVEFKINPVNSNFSIRDNSLQKMQFYSNMRFPETSLSYRIKDCTLSKEDDMEMAFNIISNTTVLNFYPVESNERIFVTCDEKNKISGGLFIAGEGGPTKIVAGDKFNVILNGEILLIKSSQCERPNIALHELLHVLGFDHSNNPNNIMYNITSCSQTIGDDIINSINELYSVPAYSDLGIVNISASMNGRYLNTEITIRNYGLRDSEKANLEIYADEKLVKELDIEPIEIGEGRIIILENVLISKISFNEINVIIDSSFNELEKENNKIKLEIKNN